MDRRLYTGSITSETQLAVAMHRIALDATTDASLIENAVGEASFVFATTGNADAAIEAGHARIRVDRDRPALDQACETLFRRPWFWAALTAAVLSMFAARLGGWWLP